MRLLLFLLMTLPASAGPLIFIGTYTRTTSKGIYAVRLDESTGALSEPVLAAATPSPSFLAFTPDQKTLYAVSESNAMAAAFGTDLAKGSLHPLQPPQPSGGAAPCHLVVDATQHTLLVANYHTGIVAAIPLLADGTLGPPHAIQHTGHSVDPSRQTSPHVHSVTLSPEPLRPRLRPRARPHLHVPARSRHGRPHARRAGVCRHHPRRRPAALHLRRRRPPCLRHHGDGQHRHRL